MYYNLNLGIFNGFIKKLNTNIDKFNLIVYNINMDIEQVIKMICVKNELNLSQLAKRLNMSPQALSQKLKRGSFSIDDLKTIAIVTNCKFDCAFILSDNEKIVL